MRRKNRKGEGGRLRILLLESAARVLTEKGPAGVTLRSVAREAKVTAPAIYQHFKDLDDLVWHLLLLTWEELATAMDKAEREMAARGPLAQLEAQLAAYIDFASENPSHYELLFAAFPDYARLARERGAPTGPVYEILLQAVTRCRDAGYTMPFPDVDPEMDGPSAVDPTTVLLFVVAHGRIAIGQASQVAPFSTREAVNAFVANALHVLVRPPGSESSTA
jgi:AcrR family transcriptional regulator